MLHLQEIKLFSMVQVCMKFHVGSYLRKTEKVQKWLFLALVIFLRLR